jgi:ribulose-phosphate 3-epimerase
MGSQQGFVEQAKELGLQIGLAVDLYTPISSVDKSTWSKLDGILLMSVKAGFAQQAFDPRVLPKIEKLRKLGFKADIQIDGGINVETGRKCIKAGANQLAVGSFLWKGDTVDKGLELLMNGVVV